MFPTPWRGLSLQVPACLLPEGRLMRHKAPWGPAKIHMAMASFHHLLGLLKSLLGCEIKKTPTIAIGAGRPKLGGEGWSPIRPTGASGVPCPGLSWCHREQPSHELGGTHQDESTGDDLPGSLDRWEVTVCRNKALHRGEAFWMGCLKDTKVVKGKGQGVLGRNKRKTEGATGVKPQASTGWWGGEGLGSWVFGWTLERPGALSAGGTRLCMVVVGGDVRLPHCRSFTTIQNESLTCSSRTVGFLYRPIVKAVWYGGGLVSWASL